MNFDYKPPRFNSAGEAKRLDQKRQVEQETELKNRKIPVFMFQGYGFRPQYHASRGGMYLDGPLCPRRDSKGEECFSKLIGDLGSKDVVCKVCEFTGVLPKLFEEFRKTAEMKYEGRQRYLESGGNIQTLDVPYEAIKQSEKDGTRDIKIKWSQKDGRDMAVIYFIDTKNNTDGDKAQIFVDFEREELRHDAIDLKPGAVVAVIKAIFPNTSIDVSYKQ
jgi:hypothetical protein